MNFLLGVATICTKSNVAVGNVVTSGVVLEPNPIQVGVCLSGQPCNVKNEICSIVKSSGGTYKKEFNVKSVTHPVTDKCLEIIMSCGEDG